MVIQKKSSTGAKSAADKEPITNSISKLINAPATAKKSSRATSAVAKNQKKSAPVVTDKQPKKVTAKPDPKVATKTKPVKKADNAVTKPAKAKTSITVGKPAKKTSETSKKRKLVRDSFTFPASDYELIGLMKARLLKAGVTVKKSELLRAGLTTLNAMSETAILNAISELEVLKPGRPAK